MYRPGGGILADWMPTEEVAAVRRLLDAFNRADFSALDELDPRAELQDEPRIPGAGWNYGYAGAVKWAVKLWQSFGRLQFGIDETLEAQDCLVTHWSATGVGKRSGIRVDMDGYCVFRMREAKIRRVEFYETRSDALEAAKGRLPQKKT
jgi:ketosteroid isomerase-like protein